MKLKCNLEWLEQVRLFLCSFLGVLCHCNKAFGKGVASM